MKRSIAILSLFALVITSTVFAQRTTVFSDSSWCNSDYHDHDDYERVCEVREITLDDRRDVIRVDAEPNGGITIHGWDKKEILVRAKIQASAQDIDVAREIVDDVSINTSGTIHATGPRKKRRQWFSVGYEIYAPRNSDVDLQTKNGGVTVDGIDAKIRFKTINGGVELADVSGDVSGRTTNGGISIELSGSHWRGSGLDVQTINGGVSIRVPEDYSADLETGTTNGRVEVDFPIMVQGKINRRLHTKLGDGGKVIRAVTTNGGVVVTRG